MVWPVVKFGMIGVAIAVLAVVLCCTTDVQAQNREGKKVLALGDSYTIGEGAAAGERWPNQLAAKLRDAGMAVADPEIIARTGWTTANLLAALRQNRSRNFDLVTLMIGVNNQYQGRSRDDFRKEFVELLGKAKALASGDAGRVIVVSIPDWGATPFARHRNRQTIAAEIDEFNAIIQAETERAGIRFVDVTPLTRELGGDAAMLTRDQLHYSGQMMGKWADLVLPTAKQILMAADSGIEPANPREPRSAEKSGDETREEPTDENRR